MPSEKLKLENKVKMNRRLITPVTKFISAYIKPHAASHRAQENCVCERRCNKTLHAITVWEKKKSDGRIDEEQR